MIREACKFPRCKRPADLIYLGRNVCVDHWRELARAETGRELELLAAIDMTRNESGEAVEKER